MDTEDLPVLERVFPMDESREIAHEYVAYAIRSGLTPSEIAYSLGFTALVFPTEEQVRELVAFKWRMLGAQTPQSED